MLNNFSRASVDVRERTTRFLQCGFYYFISVEELYCFNIVTLIYKYSDGLKKSVDFQLGLYFLLKLFFEFT